MSDALIRPVHSMLTGPQAHLAQRTGAAVRVDPSYGPFAAADDRGAAAQADLAAIVRQAAGEVYLVEPEPWPAPPGTETVGFGALVQMIAPLEGPAGEPDPAVVALGEGDCDAMAALAIATEPGPWRELTHRYGQFYGIRDGDRIAAMAGERMRPVAGHAEVSAVCTWPEHRGKGLARRLIARVMQAQRARGEAPFLHSFAHNAGAIGLYESLGFVRSRELVLTILRSSDQAK